MRKVLPKQIGSIAAAASLLAGGRLLEEKEGLIPVGAEWWSDREWERRGLWEGQVFRMGWWDRVGVEGEDNTGEEERRRVFRIDVRPSS